MHRLPCRPLRRTLPAWLALVALVFAQLAVAAHACVTALSPLQPAGLAVAFSPADGADPAAVEAGTQAGMQPAAQPLHHGCHDALAGAPADESRAVDAPDASVTPDGAPMARPAQNPAHAEAAGHLHDNLCQAHCQYGSTTVDTTSSGVQAPQPATLPPLAGLVLPTPLDAPASRSQRYAAALAPPPPPALLFGVLRI